MDGDSDLILSKKVAIKLWSRLQFGSKGKVVDLPANGQLLGQRLYCFNNCSPLIALILQIWNPLVSSLSFQHVDSCVTTHYFSNLIEFLH